MMMVTIAAAVAATTARFGTIDALANNVGYGLYGPLEGMSAEQMDRKGPLVAGSERLYDVIVRLYPRRFRYEYGAALGTLGDVGAKLTRQLRPR